MMTRIYTVLSVFCLLTSFAFADPAGDLRTQGIETQADGGQITILTGKDLKVVDNLLTSGTATITGALNIRGAVNGALILPFSVVSVTSPTATASVAGKAVISLTTNVSQTNFALTGGAQGQVVIVRGTNDSATTTFADGQSSMTLTANAALGLNDTLTLLCTSADGDEWAEISRALN